MKILLVGENPKIPSGFGMQMNMLSQGLKDRGEEVVILANNGPSFDDGRLVWHNKELMKIDQLDARISEVAPDIAIIFYHTQMVKSIADLERSPRSIPILGWLPWEGTTLPFDWERTFLGTPENTIVHMSEFGRKLWEKKAPSKYVIPHCYNDAVFKLFDAKIFDKQHKRQEWGKRLGRNLDGPLILNMDRNIWHKRWDAVFDYIKVLKKNIPDVQLIAHTEKKGQGGLTHDLEYLAKLYEVEDSIIFTDFKMFKGDAEDSIADLIRMCDVRMTASSGEGFGIINIEAAACGVPQIINNCTTMPELVGEDYFGLINPVFFEERLGALWAVPDVNEMVAMTEIVLNSYDKYSDKAVELSKEIESKFNRKTVLDRWRDVIADKVKGKSELWYNHRWGFGPNEYNRMILIMLPDIIKKLLPSGKVLELGSFKGGFVESCMEYGVDITGIEQDRKAFDRASSIAKLNMKHMPYDKCWFNADILVITDCFLDILEYEEEFTDAVENYKWLVVRRDVTSQNGEVVYVDSILSKHHGRRADLESIVTEQIFDKFNHEIWERDADTTNIPQGLINGISSSQPT